MIVADKMQDFLQTWATTGDSGTSRRHDGALVIGPERSRTKPTDFVGTA